MTLFMFIYIGYWVIYLIHTKTAIFILHGKCDSLKTQNNATVKQAISSNTTKFVVINHYVLSM